MLYQYFTRYPDLQMLFQDISSPDPSFDSDIFYNGLVQGISLSSNVRVLSQNVLRKFNWSTRWHLQLSIYEMMTATPYIYAHVLFSQLVEYIYSQTLSILSTESCIKLTSFTCNCHHSNEFIDDVVVMSTELLLMSSSCQRNYYCGRRHAKISSSCGRRPSTCGRRPNPNIQMVSVPKIRVVSLKSVALRTSYTYSCLHLQYQTLTVVMKPTISLQTFEAVSLRRPLDEDFSLRASYVSPSVVAIKIKSE